MEKAENFNNRKQLDETTADITNSNDVRNGSKRTSQKRVFETAKYRNNLPQLSDEIFLTDGGLETTLIFHEKVELPLFSSFPLLETQSGVHQLQRNLRPFVTLARDLEVDFILESATWRANADWGKKLGYSEKALANVNRKAIDFLSEIRDEFETEKSKMVISGCVGPRGDGYSPSNMMSVSEAEQYHTAQIRTFSETPADMISAFTLNYVEEAIGIVQAAKSARIPSVISFTVETDGKLPTGQTLKEAIETVDEATDNSPAYFMINCAHPTHFESVLTNDEPWLQRIRGIRANSSVKSHAELDESEELDEGNPVELSRQYRELLKKLKNLNIFGVCCGTDFRHVKEIAGTCIVRR
jgi:S-methylmethionine-dependent homocysteine/selenocysteine methylase